MTNVLGLNAARRAKLAAAMAQNDQWYQRLVTAASIPIGGLTAEYGYRDALLYQITGLQSHADLAYQKFLTNGVPLDTVAPYPSWPNASPSKDYCRHEFILWSLTYSWIADAITPTQKAIMRSRMQYLVDRAWFAARQLGDNSEGLGPWSPADSDQLMGMVMGLYLFAEAIRDEEPAAADAIINNDPTAGGLGDYKTGGYAPGVAGSYRDSIKQYFDHGGSGGVWVESSEYNVQTVYYMFMATYILNEWLGVDHFPEITSEYNNYAHQIKLQLTPDQSNQFLWGDVENQFVGLYHNINYLGVLAGVTGDGELFTLADTKLAGYGSSGMVAGFFLFMDPNATRSPLNGSFDAHLSSGFGQVLTQTGRDGSSNRAMMMFYRPNERGFKWDHYSFHGSNVMMWRNGAQCLHYPVAYSLNQTRFNTTFPRGVIWGSEESIQHIHMEEFSDGAYVAGVQGGHVYVNTWNAPEEWLHEHSVSMVGFHLNDGSDVIFQFDRINASNPLEIDRSKYEFACLNTELTGRQPYRNALSCHAGNYVIVHTHTLASVVGSVASWTTPGNETMSLHFLPGSDFDWDVRASESADMSASGAPDATTGENDSWPMHMNDHSGQGPSNAALKSSLHFRTDPADTFQNIGQIYHCGSTGSGNEYLATTGGAKAIQIETTTDSRTCIFNGILGNAPFTSAYGTPMSTQPSQVVSNFAVYNGPQKIQDLKDLHYHEAGYAINITTTVANAKVYLFDLDPAATWTLDTGSGAASINPSAQGVHQVTLGAAGAYTLTTVRT